MATTHAEALVEELDQHVRELVRREGIDPQRGQRPGVVRRIAEGVVISHDERSLTGAVAGARRHRRDHPAGRADSGFGPLQRFLDDSTVEEVWIDEPDACSSLARGGPSSPPGPHGSGAGPGGADAQAVGSAIDLSAAFVDAMLPEGRRFHVVSPASAGALGRQHPQVRRPRATRLRGAGRARYAQLTRPRSSTPRSRPDSISSSLAERKLGRRRC